MIKSKKDLKYYLQEDLKRYGKKPKWFLRFIYNERYYIYKFFVNLRHYEFYRNNRGVWYYKILYIFYALRYERLSFKYLIRVPANVIGPGFYYVHPGFLCLNPDVRIGKNATVLPNVLIGRKTPDVPATIVIGDNCYISTGVTILGQVQIGNNVTIGANAVVTKDIPDNCVVGGVPATIIKRK
ncbi:serine acetyltransferase [Polaribacter atrinae]|uniref:serine acetyltransferase n=1 Tax=Polaribacter atrinae TaxID=1333662 RepID=UPI0030F5C884